MRADILHLIPKPGRKHLQDICKQWEHIMSYMPIKQRTDMLQMIDFSALSGVHVIDLFTCTCGTGHLSLHSTGGEVIFLNYRLLIHVAIKVVNLG